MEIQIDPHTLERAQERGTTEEEIRDVIETGLDIPAKYVRSMSSSKNAKANIMYKKELKYFT